MFLRKQLLLPVSLIQDYNLVSTFRECDLLLGKHFYFVSHNINSTKMNNREPLINRHKLQNMIIQNIGCTENTHYLYNPRLTGHLRHSAQAQHLSWLDQEEL